MAARIPCVGCGKTFKTKQTLQSHRRKTCPLYTSARVLGLDKKTVRDKKVHLDPVLEALLGVLPFEMSVLVQSFLERLPDRELVNLWTRTLSDGANLQMDMFEALQATPLQQRWIMQRLDFRMPTRILSWHTGLMNFIEEALKFQIEENGSRLTAMESKVFQGTHAVDTNAHIVETVNGMNATWRGLIRAMASETLEIPPCKRRGPIFFFWKALRLSSESGALRRLVLSYSFGG